MSKIRVGATEFSPENVVKDEQGNVSLRVGCQDVVVSPEALQELNSASAKNKLWLVMLCGDDFISTYVDELSAVMARFDSSNTMRCGSGKWSASMLTDSAYRAVIVMSPTKPKKHPLR